MARLKYAIIPTIIIILILSTGCSSDTVESISLSGSADYGLDLYSSCRVISDDGQILITWDGLDRNAYDQITADIYSDDTCVFSDVCSTEQTGISFTGGTHGQLYLVTVAGGSESISCKRLFLDYDKLPDLPVINIDTVTGLDPSYEIINPEEEYLHGTSITGSEYVESRINIYGLDTGTVSDTARIKVRGNASNFSYNGKVNYRLKLSSKHDFIRSGSSYKSKQWILLNCGCELNTFIGDKLSEMVGMEYSSEMIFVNVMLNGDWKGCYCLTPAVSRSNMKDLVSASGYIFENDVYFWNEDGLFFKTDDTLESMGYTFTYPDVGDISNPKVTDLKRYMQEFEDYLYAGDERYKNYIDEDSFAKWLLVRDIMGEGDPLGANVYYYKRDFDPQDPTSSKLKMGPLWDFDTMCGSPGEWCGNRKRGVTYFEELMKQEDFRALYTCLWDEISPDLVSYISGELDTLDPDALNKSWGLDQNRWNYNVSSFDKQRSSALNWFELRSGWINKELLMEKAHNGPLSVSDFTPISGEVDYNIDSEYESDGQFMITGWAVLKNIPYIPDQMQIALMTDSDINLTGSVIRHDVKKAFDLNYTRPGFYIYLSDRKDYTVVILDYYNKIMYTP